MSRETKKSIVMQDYPMRQGPKLCHESLALRPDLNLKTNNKNMVSIEQCKYASVRNLCKQVGSLAIHLLLFHSWKWACFVFCFIDMS